MQDFLNFLITKSTGITDFEIKVDNDPNETIYEIITPEMNIGLLIGKEGKTVKSLRKLLKTKAALEGERVNLIISPKV